MADLFPFLFPSLESSLVLWSSQPAIFFGLYSASFVHSVRWLLFEDEGWRIRKKINWWLLTTTLLVFFLSMALLCAVVMEILITNWDPLSMINGTIAYLLVLDTFSSSAIQWSILMAIDSVMIYRCWIVFSKNWFVICFPMVLWCFCLICAILSFSCYVIAVFNFSTVVVQTGQAAGCLAQYIYWTPLAFYVCNIIVNIYTTSALVYKIWRAAKNNVGTNGLYRISRILAESGILYTLSSLFYLISWIQLNAKFGLISGFNSFHFVQPQYIGIAIPFLVPLYYKILLAVSMFMPGIAFNLIIIRIGEQRAKGEDTWVDSRDANNAVMPPELPDHPDMSTQGEDRHERMDEGEVMEINEVEAGEIMEVGERLEELSEQ